MLRFNIYSTQWGAGAVVFSSEGLKDVLFPCENDKLLDDELLSRYERVEYDETTGTGLCSTLGLYFYGERVRFREKLDLSGRSPFEIAVYDMLKAIPYGDTTTYAALAEQCGYPRAARAVGNAMHKNSIPVVVPCHRVLKSDGGIGGWSGKSGWKERLLAMESGNAFHYKDDSK